MDKIAVVINAGAGQGNGRERAYQVEAAFRRAGLDAHVALARDGAQVSAAVSAALDRGAQLVVGGGGDGTLNQVASALLSDPRGANTQFGVLPLGTLNHFAKDLGIPLELDAAVAVLTQGRVAEIDTAEVNGNLFLNNSSLGLYPEIVRERERQQDRLGRGKWPAFAWACLAALRRYSFHTVRLRVDGREHVRRTPFVFVGNNDYDLSGMAIGERARLDRGELCVWVAHRPSRLGLLWFGLAALFGQLHRVHGLDHLRTDQLVIESHGARRPVSTDGEVQEMSMPLRYRSRPRSLRVRVPAVADAVKAAA
jgi:diacylglycerol kinase family enzyme